MVSFTDVPDAQMPGREGLELVEMDAAYTQRSIALGSSTWINE